jgi:pimeloyl-ACP methyl ester carboxylesterase
MMLAIAAASYRAATPAAAPPRAAELRMLQRADGSSIAYQLNRDPRIRRQGALLVMQGSGCEPVSTDRGVRSTGPALAPDSALLTIEKYGVATGDTKPMIDGCPVAYWRGNTLWQRVLDGAHVIAALRGEPWWNGELILFGGSEGGAVVAMLAPLVPETRAVVIWSSGIGVPVGDLIRAAVPPHVRADAERVFAEARANPSGERRWGGASWRWWAEALDVVPARSLLQTPAPVLMIHGTRDQFAPVAAGRAARDLLVQSGKRNVTYREYEGYDHFMTDAGGTPHRKQVLQAAADWLRSLRPDREVK